MKNIYVLLCMVLMASTTTSQNDVNSIVAGYSPGNNVENSTVIIRPKTNPRVVQKNYNPGNPTIVRRINGSNYYNQPTTENPNHSRVVHRIQATTNQIESVNSMNRGNYYSSFQNNNIQQPVSINNKRQRMYYNNFDYDNYYRRINRQANLTAAVTLPLALVGARWRDGRIFNPYPLLPPIMRYQPHLFFRQPTYIGRGASHFLKQYDYTRFNLNGNGSLIQRPFYGNVIRTHPPLNWFWPFRLF